MKGDDKVIEILNEILTAELTAVNQYFIHAKMCGDWGYRELEKYARAESIDEMRHAEIVIERILFLDGTPNLQRYFKINVGTTVPEQLKQDRDLEYKAIERLNKAVEICVEAKDHTTRQLVEKILAEEEHHADWLEAQLHQIDDIGLAEYLQHKIGPVESEGH